MFTFSQILRLLVFSFATSAALCQAGRSDAIVVDITTEGTNVSYTVLGRDMTLAVIRESMKKVSAIDSNQLVVVHADVHTALSSLIPIRDLVRSVGFRKVHCYVATGEEYVQKEVFFRDRSEVDLERQLFDAIEWSRVSRVK